MQRLQIYLSESHLKALALLARTHHTTHSALIREALDQYLARQTPQDKRAARAQAFGAWLPNRDTPTPSSCAPKSGLADAVPAPLH